MSYSNFKLHRFQNTMGSVLTEAFGAVVFWSCCIMCVKMPVKFPIILLEVEVYSFTFIARSYRNVSEEWS